MSEEVIEEPIEKTPEEIAEEEARLAAEEAARLAREAEEARLAAIQTRIDALGDLALVIDAYVKTNSVKDCAFNDAFFKNAKHLETPNGWSGSLPKPTLEQLEALKPSVDADSAARKTAEDKIKAVKTLKGKPTYTPQEVAEILNVLLERL